MAFLIPAACTGPPPTHARSPSLGRTPSPRPPAPRGRHERAAYTGLGLNTIKDVEYESAGGHALRMDVYLPANRSTPLPGVLVLHGGGFAVGDKTWVAWEAKSVAMAGMVAFSADYRVAPKDPYPAAVNDVQAAVVWIRRHAAAYGVDPTRIAAFGGSAGGTLAGELATAGTGPLDRGSRIAAAVSWSGLMNLRSLAVGGSPVDRSIVVLYLQCGPHPEVSCPNKLARASPLSSIDRTDPPMFLGASMHDYIPYTQATTMAAELKTDGIFVETNVVPGYCHSIQCKGKLIISTLGFLRTELGVSAAETENVGSA